MRNTLVAVVLACAVPLTAQTPSGERPPQATSLLGEPLHIAPLPDDVRAEREAQRAAAAGALEDAYVWYGRRTAYLGDYRAAIAIYTDARRRFPDSARLLRHRGHRYISVRELDRAIADLQRAAALVEGRDDVVEPDGMPNVLNIPTSTLQTNIFYHLALAHYLRREWGPALDAQRQCLARAKNDDMRCASAYWAWLTLRRLGRADEAAALLGTIDADMDVIENHEYHRLLLLFKGELTPGEVLGAVGAGEGIGGATTGYGVGAWHLLEGRVDEATALFRRVAADDAWAAFGHIAAEAELAARPEGERLFDR